MRRSSTHHLDADGRIVFGATVELEDAESGDSVIYQIVGDDEADIKQRKISVSSPIARRADRQVCGHSVDVQAPGGLRQYEVLTCIHIMRVSGTASPDDAGTVDRGIWAIAYVARRCCLPASATSKAGVLAASCLK